MIYLYHGSNVKVGKPDLAHSKPFKDFGRGFYLSPDRKQAEEMAIQRASIADCGEPVVSIFAFDDSVMGGKELKVKIFSDYSEEWAQFVLDNRNQKKAPYEHGYDIVYGPIADDGVAYQLRRYEGGVISLDRLVEELKYAKGITFQYFFGTEKALAKLSSVSDETDP